MFLIYNEATFLSNDSYIGKIIGIALEKHALQTRKIAIKQNKYTYHTVQIFMDVIGRPLKSKEVFLFIIVREYRTN